MRSASFFSISLLSYCGSHGSVRAFDITFPSVSRSIGGRLLGVTSIFFSYSGHNFSFYRKGRVDGSFLSIVRISEPTGDPSRRRGFLRLDPMEPLSLVSFLLLLFRIIRIPFFRAVRRSSFLSKPTSPSPLRSFSFPPGLLSEERTKRPLSYNTCLILSSLLAERNVPPPFADSMHHSSVTSRCLTSPSVRTDRSFFRAASSSFARFVQPMELKQCRQRFPPIPPLPPSKPDFSPVRPENVVLADRRVAIPFLLCDIGGDGDACPEV